MLDAPYGWNTTDGFMVYLFATVQECTFSGTFDERLYSCIIDSREKSGHTGRYSKSWLKSLQEQWRQCLDVVNPIAYACFYPLIKHTSSPPPLRIPRSTTVRPPPRAPFASHPHPLLIQPLTVQPHARTVALAQRRKTRIHRQIILRRKPSPHVGVEIACTQRRAARGIVT